MLDELTTGLDPQARRDAWDLIEAIRDRGVTIVLVTHFMEEAERLCDRLALIDAGRVVALDTPAGLVAGGPSEQRITFRPPAPLTDETVLTSLPAVKTVAVDNDRFVVTGNDDLLVAVVTALAARGLAPIDLHTEQTTLDDAFLLLAGKNFEGAN